MSGELRPFFFRPALGRATTVRHGRPPDREERQVRLGERIRRATTLWLTVAIVLSGIAPACGSPPTIRPFGPRKVARDDAIPGYAELSDSTIHLGKLYLTRDARLKVNDQAAGRQREIPLRVVRKIENRVEREWLEKEWRFKENASDEKVFTGRAYPVRESVHTITLRDGRKIVGPLSAIVYVAAEGSARPGRLILYKRQKGPVGTQLKSLIYVRQIVLGKEAVAEGRRLIQRAERKPKRRVRSGSTPGVAP
jgi:hypothetical protein